MRAHAGRRLHHPPRPARRAPASRRVNGMLRGARRAPDGAHLGRRHSRQRRLQGGAGAEAIAVGTVNEDFAVESLQGDISSSAIPPIASCASSAARCASRTRTASRRHPVLAGRGAGRSDELSARCRGCAPKSQRARPGRRSRARHAGCRRRRHRRAAAAQLVEYLAAGRAALGACRRRHRRARALLRRVGGMQLVIHSPFGSRVNRAWGLALRKRFCRTFNFELQAAATEDTSCCR
jgi:ATP-dependent Lhr-like helicase